jgi:hypothetical protein
MEYEVSFAYSKQPVVGLKLQSDTPSPPSSLKILFNIVLPSDDYSVIVCKEYIHIFLVADLIFYIFR